MLSHLDGEEYYAVALWEMPAGQRLDDIDMDAFPDEYIQCAGSSEAMTVEIRTMSGDTATQYVVGRFSEGHSGEPEVEIPWNAHVVEVYEDEVFDAEAATEIFAHYLAHGTVPDELALRPLELGQ